MVGPSFDQNPIVLLGRGAMFDNMGSCTGVSAFGIGTNDSDKAQHCKDRFLPVLNGCQTNTITSKLGGLLQDVCIIATHQDDPDPFAEKQWWYDMGDLRCEETNTTDIGGSSSPLAGTCTCWYLGYDYTTDVFKMPSSNNCSDVNLADLVNN